MEKMKDEKCERNARRINRTCQPNNVLHSKVVKV